MINKTTGNLLDSHAEALVNAVNSAGVMGKGLALEFKEAFPDNYAAYAAACRRGEVEPGRMFVFSTKISGRRRFIINFPTKRHWRAKSRIENIEFGLKALVEVLRREKIRSVALPRLGCGNGGLDWDDVRPRIERAFADVPEVEVELYEAGGSRLKRKSRSSQSSALD